MPNFKVLSHFRLRKWLSKIKKRVLTPSFSHLTFSKSDGDPVYSVTDKATLFLDLGLIKKLPSNREYCITMNEESEKLTLSKFARSVHYTERSDFSSTSPRWSIRLSWWTASRCPKPLISSKPVWSLCSECFCEIDRAPCAPGWKIGKLCSPPFVRACTPCSMRETYEQSTRGCVSCPISGI